MSRAVKQRRRGARKSAAARSAAKGSPAQKFNEAMRPDGAVLGPKGPSDPKSRLVHWGN